jgi:hypothetical protein
MKKIRSSIILAAALLAATISQAQIITTSPIWPSRHSTVTFTYDATQGNAALVGVTPVYAHTGLITTQSGGNWTKVQGNWGTADSRVLMTDIGGNKHKITYNVDNFYGATTADTIIKLAFVFRNAAGTTVGRTATGGDIYFTLYDDSLHCAFMSPKSRSNSTAALNSTMNFFCAASKTCTMTLYANGNQLAQVQDDSLFYNNFTFLNYGKYHFLLTTNDGIQQKADSIDVIVAPPVTQQDPPAGTKEGINYINDSTVILCLLAPHKSFVYAMGDFNNWQELDPNYFMKRALDAERYWVQIDHLIPQKEYIFQYAVDGFIKVGDPYADKVSDPDVDNTISSQIYPNLIQYPYGKTTGIATVFQTAQQPYQWQTNNFVKPNKHNLVIYECLVRDFVPQHYWQRMIDSLPYLQALGINAIELMPIMNFEGNESWGYNPNYFCAPEKVYGPKNDLKKFIDVCHQRGIAVLLDIALNQAFSTCPMVKMYWDDINKQPAADNPWFNQQATHPFSVGYDFNHDSRYTRRFIDRVNRYWVQEFHADGYRFDLTKGYTQTYSGDNVGLWQQYDAARVYNLERMVDSIWAIDSTSIMIFEHLSDNPEQIELSNHGILLWGNMNAEYNQNTMGYNTNADLSWASYQTRGWTNANLVAYMESHDEERLMYRNLQYGNIINGYNAKTLDTALQRNECAGALFFPLPGPKMLWQFGERGYDVSINQFCRICTKPMLWNYMRNPKRVHLYRVWAALIKLKLTYAPFSTTNYNIDMGGVVKRIRLNHSQFNVISIGNFDVVRQNAYPVFHHTGWWYDYFTGDSLNVTDVNMFFSYKPGEYHLYTDTRLALPDLTTPTTGIDEVAYTQGSVTVYPVPTDGLLHFSTGAGEEIKNVTIYDLQGRVVAVQDYDGDQTVVSLDLPNSLGSGIYFYTLTDRKTVHSGKLSYAK